MQFVALDRSGAAVAAGRHFATHRSVRTSLGHAFVAVVISLLAACGNTPEASPVDAGDDTDDASPETCGADTRWTCDGDERVRCAAGAIEREACGEGCLAPTAEDGDAVCIERDASWNCDSSEYMGEQYWTCDPAKGELHRCDAGGGLVAVCATGCVYGPAGTHDSCLPPGGSTMIPLPNIVFNISGGLVTEAQVRGPIEIGVRKMLDLMVATMDIPPGTTLPTITLNLSPANQSYCSGIASATSANVYCPYGYPVTGDNQNFVVNISVHEIGHIVARQVLNAQAHVDHCENEGLATWLAKSYWANFQSSPLPTLRDAARAEIDAGRATASMSNCVLAADAPYKVYGSFFEYLETIPGAAQRITSGQTTSAEYVAGWRVWLDR